MRGPQLTYLGHAGFLLETEAWILAMDPWLSRHGAFDSAWFQYPRNHHLAPWVRAKLAEPGKERLLYISHEHQDHFDTGFLESLPLQELRVIVPHFRRDALRRWFVAAGCLDVVSLRDGETLPLPGGSIKLFVHDSELNRDSALLVRAADTAFLDFNDCKLYDRLAQIRHSEGSPDVFACQFSGATWHPVCYDYSEGLYEALSRKKYLTKFGTVAKAIETLEPKIYLPSAGPSCFLDPQLFGINFQPCNIFPQAADFIQYLSKRLPESTSRWPLLEPGQGLELGSLEAFQSAPLLGRPADRRVELETYASAVADLFGREPVDVAEVFERLRQELEEKLENLPLAERVEIPLYFGLFEAKDRWLRVDFANRSIAWANLISEANFYSVTAPAWQIARVLDRKLTWEEFALTFRMKLKRFPDAYQPILHGYLILETEDLPSYCQYLQELENRRERVVVEAGSKRYAIDRFCPHQGGDLLSGWADGERTWVCPRHRWQFDLEEGGRCTTNHSTIRAEILQDSPALTAD